tara:strand:+ start:4410 stop:8693 length:4284 start_codon:yes stop_codon:yes gene_type:complete
MANLLGDGFSNYVRKQIIKRQEVHGKQNRSQKELAYLNSRTAWIKLVSGVSIDNSRLKMLGLQGVFSEGLSLAKEFVLFNGTSKVKTKSNGSNGKITQREGIFKGPLSNRNSFKNNFAYGLGGVEFGPSPMPGIVDMQINHAGTRGSLRKAQITIKAYNRQQLDLIDVLYLRLGYTLMIEFGHSEYINNKGKVVNLESTLLEEKFFNQTIAKKSYLELLPLIEKKRFETCGNYDALFGRITNFHWSFENDGTYNIRIDLYSLGDLAESLTISHPGSRSSSDLSNAGTSDPTYTRNVVSEYLEDIKNFHKYRFTPGAEADVLPPETKEEQNPETAPDAPTPSTEYTETTLEGLLALPALNKTLKKKGYKTIAIPHDYLTTNTTYNEPYLHDKDDLSGSGLIFPPQEYVQYEGSWFLKKNMIEYFEQVKISYTPPKDPNSDNVFDKFGRWKATKLTKFENQYKLNRELQILIADVNQPNSTFLNPFEDDKNNWNTHLGGKKNSLILAYENFVVTGKDENGEEAFKLAVLESQVNSIIIDDQGLGQHAGVNVLIGADTRYDIQAAQEAGTLNTFEDLQEIEDENNIQFTAGSEAQSMAAGIADYNLALDVKNAQQALEDAIGKPDIHFQIGLDTDIDSVYQPFGKCLNLWESWQGIQPSGDYLYPQGKLSCEIAKLDYIDNNAEHPDDYGFFIRFGCLLDFIREKVLYKIGDTPNEKDKNDIPNTPILDIDTDMLSNVMYTLPNHISLNQKVCIVNNQFKFKKLFVQTFDGMNRFQSTDPYYGMVMNIYLNFALVQEVMDSCTTADDSKKVYLYEALSGICNAVNEAMGGINNLEPVIDEKTNCLKIIDSSRLPNIKEITDFLHKTDPKKYNYPKDLKSFNYNKFTLADGSIKYDLNLYGYNPKDDSSNFIHNIDLSTSVTKNMSTMLAIGAAAQGGYVVGEESTMFSKWNEGITDRFMSPVLNADGTEANSSSSFAKQWDNVRIDYGNFIIDNFYSVGKDNYYPYWGETLPPPTQDGAVGYTFNVPGNLNDEQILKNLSIGTEFYKMLMASASIANDHSLSAQPGFLPINLQVDMDGLSGIKIYEKANIDISFLPTNYPQTLDFLSTGLKHFVKDNKWETTLTTQATTIGTFKRNAPLPKIFSIDAALEELELTDLTSQNLGYDDESGWDIYVGCSPYNPQKYNFVLQNQFNTYADTSKNPNYYKALKLLSHIWSTLEGNEDSSGYCSRFVKSLATKFWTEWNQYDTSPYKANGGPTWQATPGTFTPEEFPGAIYGTQDAKSKLTSQNLSNLYGYKIYPIGTGIAPGDNYASALRKYIKAIDFFPGDIIIYWDSSGLDGGDRGYQKYGHIQMYLGGVKPFISDFAHSEFVYGGWSKKYKRWSINTNNCFNMVYLRSKLNPITMFGKPDPVMVNIGERAEANPFSPINKL